MLGAHLRAQWHSESWTFWTRFLLSIIIVPSLAFLPLTAVIGGGDWIVMTFLYGLFGSGAMLLFGAPLALFFTLCRLTGFLSFAVAGALCATATILIVNGRRDPGTLPFFAVIGMIAGYLFRFILFGFKR